jgi:hypothetical protein
MTIKVIKSSKNLRATVKCWCCQCEFAFGREDTFYNTDRFWRIELVKCPECEQEIGVQQHLTPWRK